MDRDRAGKERDRFRPTFVVELQIRVGGDDGGQQTELALVAAKVGNHGAGRYVRVDGVEGLGDEGGFDL